MEGLLGWISGWPAYIHAIFGIVSAATALTAITPSKADDKIVNTMLTVLNMLAGNVMKNRNKDA
jgi:uncharacterized membrane protein YqaE (UPF0057 family)|tara:strand:+ start:1252 stop:1443 length:192 start_codon:yes stop_codon:yes gene_type:complete